MSVADTNGYPKAKKNQEYARNVKARIGTSQEKRRYTKMTINLNVHNIAYKNAVWHRYTNNQRLLGLDRKGINHLLAYAIMCFGV